VLTDHAPTGYATLSLHDALPILGAADVDRLIGAVASRVDVHPNAEITIEANPDDLDEVYVKALRTTPINRFSIGIQSFFEEDLRDRKSTRLNSSHVKISYAVFCL